MSASSVGKLIVLPALFSIFAALLVGCAPKPDPIDFLVKDLSSSSLWDNGIFPMLGLPETASIEQVVSETFKKTGFDKGQVTSFKILRVRQVHIHGSLPDLYTAVLVQTDLGEKIVLLKYQGDAAGWWSRVYDANKT
jgi:hypothetical protein